MPAQGSGHATHQCRAFSLAELMIALVILGLGLLFIAAALPVGLKYTQETVNLGIAEAAANYAVEQLEQNLRTSGDALYDVSLAMPPTRRIHRLDNFHRPRNADPSVPPAGDYALHRRYEPFIKVRPLVAANLRFGVVPPGATREIVDDVESTITEYLDDIMHIPPAPLETDFDLSAGTGLSLAENPVLPGLARVYPPIEPVTTFSVAAFFNDGDVYPTYDARFNRLDPFEELDREREKTLDRRVAWTAFYRRVTYRGELVDGQWRADYPLLYELIVVVTRRTSLNHRFPRQNLAVAGLLAFEQPTAWSPGEPPDDAVVGTDRLAPMPWLATFDSSDPDALPLLDPDVYATLFPDPSNPNHQERVLLADFVDRPTLTFHCTPQVGALLPVGSVFIPAVNDLRYVPPPQQVGFVPSGPDSLPIYEVVERPDDTTVIVENNGYYPWVVTEDPSDTQAWPVWVIPPAFAERDSNGQPVYERRSPILSVVRRVVTLHEVAP